MNDVTARETRTFNAMLVWLGLAGVVVIIDQLTKWLVVANLALGEQVMVLPFFRWVHWQNPGAAFSLLRDLDARWYFVGLAIVISVFIIYELRHLPVGNRLMGWVYGLILGGALGNGTDRLLTGLVVDFARFEYGRFGFPAFNVADSALTIGACLWIGLMLVEYRRARAKAKGGGDGVVE
jgi:signal peptidase II